MVCLAAKDPRKVACNTHDASRLIVASAHAAVIPADTRQVNTANCIDIARAFLTHVREEKVRHAEEHAENCTTCMERPARPFLHAATPAVKPVPCRLRQGRRQKH
eukprot:353183-Chlamydomonas_euryale.AAC.11